jgi:hypothetical protein
MPRKSFTLGVIVTLLGLFIAVPAAVLTAASAAFADGGRCCRVSIDNLPGQFYSGGNPQPFTLRVVNQTQQTLRRLNVSFVLQANGLVGDLVHLQRQRVIGGPHSVGTFTQHGVHSGAVTANDQIDFGTLALPPGGGVNIQYLLSFNKKMPGTGLAVSVQVLPRRTDGGVSSAGPYQSMIVAAGQPAQTQPDPTPTPSPTAAASETAAAAGTTGVGAAPTDQSSLANGGSSTGGGGALMWLAYTIGALLVLGGIAVIGTLAWRRGPNGVETFGDEKQQYGHPTYPTQPLGRYTPTRVAEYGMPPQTSGHAAPTRVVPVVYNAPGRHAAPTAQFPVPQEPPDPA